MGWDSVDHASLCRGGFLLQLNAQAGLSDEDHRHAGADLQELVLKAHLRDEAEHS
jgi:hypothetical protein